jgi:phage terminase large subunit-like protein
MPRVRPRSSPVSNPSSPSSLARRCHSKGEWAGQTFELEKLIVSRKLAHGGNPVTRWMAANVAVAQDPAGNLKPAKDKSTERIDGIVALIMAIGRALVVQKEPQPSYQVIIF